MRLWSIVLRAGVTLALILGVGVITGWVPAQLVNAHMVVGLVVIVAAWALALPELLTPGGNKGLGAAALVLGLLLPVIGVMQLFFEPPGRYAMQGLHVLIALGLPAVAERAAARRRRAAAVAA